jgi:iron complex outermembrane recepter protein
MSSLCIKYFSKAYPVLISYRSSTSTTSQLKEGAVRKLQVLWGFAVRTGVIASLVCLCLVGLANADNAKASIRKDLNVPAEDLSPALQTVATTYEFQVLYPTSIVKDLKTSGAVGSLTSDEALRKVLTGTGLTYKFLDSNTITVFATPAPSATSAAVDQSKTTQNKAKEGQNNSNSFRVAQVDQGKGSGAAAVGNQASSNAPSGGLAEIIVTATRREESAQNVPGGLQVFSGSDLDRQGANQFADYLLTVPGISFRDQGAGAERIAIRGVSNVAGSDNGITAPTSTTGLYLNDISISDTSNLPDIATYDLKRVEVLKGPQGTLYGDGSMGGAVKMVLNEPDLNEAQMKADTTVSDTQGGGVNYGGRALMNIPLIPEKLALRIAGTYQNLDGFIDNTYNGQSNINSSREYSVRGLLLGQITDKFSAEVLILESAEHQDHFNQEDPSLGDLKIVSVEPEFNNVKNDVFGLTLKYDAGFAELSSISSYYSAQRQQVIRVPVLANPVFGAFGTVTQDPLAFDIALDSVAQELRLVSEGDNRFDWVVGGYFRNKRQRGIGNIFIAQSDLPSVNAGLAADMLPTLPSSGTILATDETDRYKEYAFYGEGTYKIIKGLDFTAGLRWYHETVSEDSLYVGNSILAAASGAFNDTTDYSGVIPKFALAYHITDNHIAYAQASEGFRSGTVNVNQSFQVGGVAAKPDTLWNYELGLKTKWADGRLLLNGSAYYIDWKDVQTFEAATSPISHTEIGFFGNGGNARIDGLEIELAAAPTHSILLGATLGYTHSKMTTVTDGSSILGATLPNVPALTESAFGEFRFQLIRAADSYVRLDAQHIDAQATRPITTTSDGAWVNAYTLASLHAGFDTERWGLAFFIDNISNERAELGRGITGAGAIYNLERYTIARPRTFGLRFSVSN